MTPEKFDTTGSHVLVQRFLDHELSAEERVRFISRLGRDPMLRRTTIELEQLVLETSRLPRPTVPEGFVAAVMERTVSSKPAALAEPSWGRRLFDMLWTPRHLQWNVASAAGIACVALLTLWGAVAILNQRSGAGSPASVAAAHSPTASAPPSTATASAPPSGTTAPSSTSPTALPPTATAPPSTVLVRLVVLQASARTVQVAGDFNGWNPALTSLEQISKGAWAVTIPLEPGRYEYMFVVDGRQWIADPFAAEHDDDGFGSRNAVLEVRPPSRARS